MYFTHPQIKLKDLKKILKPFNPKQRLDYMFPKKQLVFTDMGRSAFRLILEKANLKNTEMMLPAYTCDIFYPILKEYNISPIFLDIDIKTFNINLEEIEKKRTPQTKSILISHTYGLPISIQKIKKNTNLLIIEDCAHSWGAQSNRTYVGNLGDISFFSLYKQFPSSRGGLLVCPQDWQIDIKKTSFSFRDLISFLNYFPLFSFLFKKLGSGIAPRAIRKEKKGISSQINKVSLKLFYSFLKDFELEKRIHIALFFQQELKNLGFEIQESKDNIFTFLSVLSPEKVDRDKFVKNLRKYGIFCTRIWKDPIILNPDVQKEYNLDIKDFPNTIKTAKRIINFPLQSYYTKKDIEKIINAIKKYFDNSQNIYFPKS